MLTILKSLIYSRPEW